MKTKIYNCILLFILALSGCVSEFNANLPSDATEALVVEGDIIGNTEQIIYLKKTFPLTDTLSYNTLRYSEINAKVKLTGSDGSQTQGVYLGAGRYSMTIGTLNDDVEYSLEVEYNGDTYKSTPAKPLITPEIDSVSFQQKEEYGDVTIHISTHDDSGASKYFLWNYTEDWEITSTYYTTLFLDSYADTFYIVDPAPFYYCWKNNTINPILIASTDAQTKNSIVNKTILKLPQESDRFSVLYSINVVQKAISGAAYDYYKAKLSASEGMGGLFTPQPTEPGGNITCINNGSKKALGYIEVLKNTSEKRIFINRGDISRRSSSGCIMYMHDEVLARMNAELIETFAQVVSWLRLCPVAPLDPDIKTGLVPAFWSSDDCTDCRLNGTKTRPDFWPNNGHN